MPIPWAVTSAYLRASVLLIGAVAMSACRLFGPSESIEGFWVGRGGGLGGNYVVSLKLRQTGNIITGQPRITNHSKGTVSIADNAND